MAEPPDAIARINALTTNARNTWFALLGVLVFVSITLTGVEHIDFYGVNRATKLPLVNVDVPTRYFFVAAPILTAAIYGYFHLYLIRLWDVLGDAPAWINGVRLGDVISPWLVTDVALQIRRWWRKDNCTAPRALETIAALLNGLLAWAFGLLVLYLLWSQSFPARTFWMSGISGIVFIAALLTGVTSLAVMFYRMFNIQKRNASVFWVKLLEITAFLFTAGASAFYSYQCTTGPTDTLAALVMIDEEIVERPGGWLPYAIARADFRSIWCKRERIQDCTDLKKRESDFIGEWKARREAALADMRRPDWHKIGREKPNLRGAKLKSSFLAGVDLRRVRIEGADLRVAQLEGANLRFGRMAGADFKQAQMETASVRFAQMEGTELKKANMEKVRFDFSFLTGSQEDVTNLENTNLNASINNGGAIRFVNLSLAQFNDKTDFRNAFLDGSVEYSKKFGHQMGDKLPKPCQWINKELNDQEFYAHWRWWIEANPNKGFREDWNSVSPAGWRNVALPQKPPENCHWKIEPLPGTRK